MKEVRDTIKEVQYRRLLKRSFEPRKEFVERSRAAFLEEVAKRRVAPLAPQIRWRSIGVSSFRYVATFAAIALLSTSGLVAFADNTNVSVDSPLYPLKRIGEQVRLVATPAAQEPKLREEFAQRRASELSEIETKQQPDSTGGVEQLRTLETKETELRADFRNNIEKIEEYSAEGDAASPVPATVVGASLCQAAQVVERHGGDDKSEQYKQFEDRCKAVLGTQNDSIQPVAAPLIIQNGTDKGDRQSESGKRGDSIQSVPQTPIIQQDRDERTRSLELRMKGDVIKSPTPVSVLQVNSDNKGRPVEVAKGDNVIQPVSSTPIANIVRDNSSGYTPESVKPEDIQKQDKTKSEGKEGN